MEDCIAWLENAENVFNRDLTQITEEDAMMEAFGKHELIYKEMDQRKDRIEAVLKRGNDMLASICEEDKEALKERLDLLDRRWSCLGQRASSAELNFDNFIADQETFYEDLEGFVEWLQRVGMEVSGDIDNEDASKQLSTHRVICSDIKIHEKMMQKLVCSGRKILDGLPPGRKSSFQEQLQRIISGWDDLVDEAVKKEEELCVVCNVTDGFSELSKKVRKFGVSQDSKETSMLREADDIMEKLVEIRNEVAVAQSDLDVKQQMERHLEVCLRADAQMEKIEKLAGRVEAMSLEEEQKSKLEAKIGLLQSIWNELGDELNSRRNDLERALEVEQKVERMKQRSNDLSLEDSSFDDLSKEDLEARIPSLQKFIDDVSELRNDVSSTSSDNSLVPELDGLVEKARVCLDCADRNLEKLEIVDELKLEINGFLLQVSTFLEGPGEEFDNYDEDSDNDRDEQTRGFSPEECEPFISLSEDLLRRIDDNSSSDLLPYRKSIEDFEARLKRRKEEQIQQIEKQDKLKNWKEKLKSQQGRIDQDFKDIEAKISFENISQNSAEINNEIEILAGKILRLQEENESEESEMEAVELISKKKEQLNELNGLVEQVLFVDKKLSDISQKCSIAESELSSFGKRKTPELLELCDDVERKMQDLKTEEKELKFASASIEQLGNVCLNDELRRKVDSQAEEIQKRTEALDTKISRVREGVAIFNRIITQTDSIKKQLQSLENVKKHEGMSLDESQTWVEAKLDEVNHLRNSLTALTEDCDSVADCIGSEYASEFINDIKEYDGIIKNHEEVIKEIQVDVSKGKDDKLSMQIIFNELDGFIGQCGCFESCESIDDIIENCDKHRQNIDFEIEKLRAIEAVENIQKVSKIDADELLKAKERYIEKLETSKVIILSKKDDAIVFLEALNRIEKEHDLEVPSESGNFDSFADAEQAIQGCKENCLEVEDIIATAADSFGKISDWLGAEKQQKYRDKIAKFRECLAERKDSLEVLTKAEVEGKKDREKFNSELQKMTRTLTDMKKELNVNLKDCKDVEDHENCMQIASELLEKNRQALLEFTADFQDAIMKLPRSEREAIRHNIKECKSIESELDQELANKRLELQNALEQSEKISGLVSDMNKWIENVEAVIDGISELKINQEMNELSRIENESIEKENDINQIVEILLNQGKIFV